MLIIEGLDGVGKTTLVNYFQNYGMRKYHFDYDVKNMDLLSKYMRVLGDNKTSNLILDRSFISEMVYGPIIRNKCKLSDDEYLYLLNEYKKIKSKIIYLTAPKEVLLARRKNDKKDYEMICKYYDKLNNKYKDVMDYTSKIIDVNSFDTSVYSEKGLQEEVKKMVLR